MSEYKDSFVNMISGIGIDIVDVKRFIVYSDKSDIRLSKLFTAKELDYCFRRDPPSNGLAGKFAAKLLNYSKIMHMKNVAIVSILSNSNKNILFQLQINFIFYQ